MVLYYNLDSTAKTLPLDREAERYVAIALAPLRFNLKPPPIWRTH
jgi:hypothetical protein